MDFSDLHVEYIKTLMATQRILLTKFGVAISFMGDEQGLTSGDGVNTFEIMVFKHNLNLKENVDFFTLDVREDCVDFKKPIFKMDSVPLDEIQNFFNVFIV